MDMIKMDLQKVVMEIMGSDWTTSRKLAKTIAEHYPEDFEKYPYNGQISNLSMALGPSLIALANQGLVEHDGTKWPGIKTWRRVISKTELSVDDVAAALVTIHLAKDVQQGIRMLAARTVREHPELKNEIEKATKISDESSQIGRKILGIDSSKEE
jgi:hypothetical protein